MDHTKVGEKTSASKPKGKRKIAGRCREWLMRAENKEIEAKSM
jgi:hypothetical protein